MDLAAIDAIVVDDHEPSRALNARALASLGVGDVRTASTGSEALALLRARPAALILADQRMPGMTGLELIAQVRAESAIAHARIILISGDPRVSKAAQEAGADAVLVKPALPSQVAKAVGALFAD